MRSDVALFAAESAEAEDGAAGPDRESLRVMLERVEAASASMQNGVPVIVHPLSPAPFSLSSLFPKLDHSGWLSSIVAGGQPHDVIRVLQGD